MQAVDVALAGSQPDAAVHQQCTRSHALIRALLDGLPAAV